MGQQWVNTFLDRFNRNKKSKVKGIDADAMEILCGYDWPGNVRELENLVERLVILKGFGTLGVKDLPEKYTGVSLSAPSETLALPDAGICLNTVVEEFENNLILQALKKTGGNKKEAALLLNLKRTTLIEKLKKRKLDVISTSLA